MVSLTLAVSSGTPPFSNSNFVLASCSVCNGWRPYLTPRHSTLFSPGADWGWVVDLGFEGVPVLSAICPSFHQRNKYMKLLWSGHSQLQGSRTRVWQTGSWHNMLWKRSVKQTTVLHSRFAGTLRAKPLIWHWISPPKNKAAIHWMIHAVHSVWLGDLTKCWVDLQQNVCLRGSIMEVQHQESVIKSNCVSLHCLRCHRLHKSKC